MRLFRCRRRQRITATTESQRQRRPHRHRARATTTNTLTAMVQAVPVVVTLLLLHQDAHHLLRRARSTRVTMADSRSFIRQQLAHRPTTNLSLRQHLVRLSQSGKHQFRLLHLHRLQDPHRYRRLSHRYQDLHHR